MDVVALQKQAPSATLLLADLLPPAVLSPSAPNLETAVKSVTPAPADGTIRHLKCDFRRSEFPTSLSPEPAFVVGHGQFYRSTDKMLGYRALRCAYPRAVLYLGTSPQYYGSYQAHSSAGLEKANYTGFLLPNILAATKFAMNDFNHRRHWLPSVTNNARNLSVTAAERDSGIIELRPESADGHHEVCAGAPTLDVHRLVEDCTEHISQAELKKTTGSVGDVADFFTRSHPLSLTRMQMVASRIPDGSRVLDMGCASEGLGELLRHTRRNITYCPSDIVPRTKPWRASVCNMNLGQFPLSVYPPPTHIILQGVWVYIYDKLLALNAFTCAYPKAIWVTDALFDTHDQGDVKALLADFGNEFGFSVTEFGGAGGMHPLLTFVPLRHNESSNWHRAHWRRARCNHAAHTHVMSQKQSDAGGCYQVSGSTLPSGRPALKNHAFSVGRRRE